MDLEPGKSASAPESSKSSSSTHRPSTAASCFSPTDGSTKDKPISTQDLERDADGRGSPRPQPLETVPPSISIEDAEKAPGTTAAGFRCQEDPNLVEWSGESDPENPMNWSLARKWYTTMMLSMLTFCITFSSSIFSQATQVAADEFGVSTTVTTLATSFVVLGFGLGPLLWGPLSELYGRSRPLLFGFALGAVFQIPVAVAQNIQTVLICRFLVGLFGCSPVAIVGGALSDIWDPLNRGIAGASFAGATFLGPIAGPIAGGFLVHSRLGWRWTAWVTLILQAVLGVVSVFTIQESFAPVVLQRRAKRLRRETQNWALYSALDKEKPTISGIVTKYLSRPMRMMLSEPILVLVTLYLALVYGILYLFFFTYPISFREVRGWQHPGVAALPFLGLFAGIFLGCLYVIVLTKTFFARNFHKRGTIVPEERLIAMFPAAIILPAGLFWFAWTSNPGITWVPQAIAGVPIGAGIIIIFLQGINYIVDVYLMYANSALASNTFVRGMAAATFPLFAAKMFHSLGVDWATSVLGFISTAMAPIPFLFYRFGAKIRARSRFNPEA
ncbi:hypothetical protein VTO42DRAFT_3090 [Malbranchea cinnamomea]